jgi:hypothetical protein
MATEEVVRYALEARLGVVCALQIRQGAAVVDQAIGQMPQPDLLPPNDMLGCA